MIATKVQKDVIALVRRRLELTDTAFDVSTRFADLGADSLALVDLTLALEEAFDIDIADDDVGRLRTVRDVIEYIERKVAGRRAS